MIFKSIRSKLWIGISGVLLLIILIIGLIFNLTFGDFYIKQQGQIQIDENQKVADQLSKSANTDDLINNFTNLTSGREGYFALLDINGQILAVSHRPRGGMMGMMGGGMMAGNTGLTSQDLLKVQKGQAVMQQGEIPIFNLTALTVALPVKNHSSVTAILISSLPLSPIKGSIHSIGYYILLAAILTIILGMVFSFFFSRYFTRPLLSMSKAAMQMAQQDFTSKVEIHSEDELALLGRSLNYLSQELNLTLNNLAGEKDLLDSIIQSMRDALLTFDAEGNIIVKNQQAKEYLAMISSNEIINISSLSNLKELFNKCKDTSAFVSGDINLGSYTFSARFTPILLDNATETDKAAPADKTTNQAFLCLLVDITKERKLETIRKELVGNVSHELRTPIALIRGYTEAILDKKAENPDILTMSLNYIQEEAIRMEYLVKDLLDLSILETGNTSLELEPVDINNTLGNAVNKLLPLVEEKNITIKVNPCLEPTIITGDKHRLEQVFINLLINGINYSPERGCINVNIITSNNNVSIEIIDNGLGIPVEEIPYIFDRFYKADKARQRKGQGAGIGLSLVKKIVELHHGTVSVSSNLGEGSTFIVELPKHI